MKIAIIGVGYWNHYVRVVSERSDCELVVVCDKNIESLNKVKEKYPSVETCMNTENLHHWIFDAVIVCTPLKSHFTVVKEMLQLGKHVLCEKAFTETEQQARELINLAKKKNVKLCVGHTFEYNNLVQHIQEILDQREVLGDIYYVSMTRVGMSPVRQDCNALWDLGAHDISMLVKWFGMPKTIHSFGKSFINDGVEDFVTTNLEFDGGIIANIKNSWINPVKRRAVTIVGSSRMLVFDDIAQNIIIYDKYGEHELTLDYISPLNTQVNDFIQSIQNNEKPLVDGESGLRVVRILEAGNRSMRENKTVTI